MEKKISVIVPCYNVEDYIDSCVESLVNQTLGLQYMELIFIDDASTDHTVEHLMKWEKNYPENIMLVQCEENGRQGTARNIGIQYAGGTYLGFVDADDWIELDMYETLLRKAEEFSCDIVTCRSYQNKADGTSYPIGVKPKWWEAQIDEFLEINKGEEELGLVYNDKKGNGYLTKFLKSTMEGGEWPDERFFEKPMGIICGIYKREMITDNDLFFPEKLWYEDNYWETMVNLYCKTRYQTRTPFYHYRENLSSTVQSINDERFFDRLEVEELTLRTFQNLGLFQDYYENILVRFFHYYYFNTMIGMASRFENPPYKIFCEMREKVKEYFPDYRSCAQLMEIQSPLYQKLLAALEDGFDEKSFLELMDFIYHVLP